MRRVMTGVLWMIAPVPWRGLCIAFPGLTVYMLVKATNCGCGPAVASVIDAFAMLTAIVAALGAIGQIRWYLSR